MVVRMCGGAEVVGVIGGGCGVPGGSKMGGENEKMFNFLVYHILDQQGCVRTIISGQSHLNFEEVIE